MNKRRLLPVVIFLTTLVLDVTASETKSISLNGGATATAQTTIYIHNALPVTARLKLHRDGSDNDFGQRLVSYTLISPNGANFNASRSIGSAFESFEVSMPAAGGNNTVRQWKIELKNLEPSSNAEVNKVVSGTIEFVTTGSTSQTLSFAKFDLGVQESKTKILNIPYTGNLKVQANWDTDEISVEAYQIRLEFRKGGGQIFTDTGYSRDSVILGIIDPHRLKLEVRLTATLFQTSGDWTLRVMGSSKGKIKNVDLKISVSDGIYE